MRVADIESPSNPRIKEWKRLQSRKGRRESGLFLAEGPHLVAEALRARAKVECVLVEEGRAFDVAADGVPRTTLSPSAAKALAETEAPQGVFAVCRADSLPTTRPRAGRWLLLDAIQDPGHVGTLVRTAHAAGLDGVVAGEGCADALSPKALRAAQGSTFHLPVMQEALEEWVGALQHAGTEVYAAGPGDGADYRTVRWGAGGFALVLGNEGAGVRPELIQICSNTIKIPMKGGAESLSVPVAGGVLLFRLLEQGPPDSGG